MDCFIADGVCYKNWQKVLQLPKQKLVENLCPEEVIDYLWQYATLSDRDRNEIMSQTSLIDINTLLVNKLVNMKPWEFVCLYNSLMEQDKNMQIF